MAREPTTQRDLDSYYLGMKSLSRFLASGGRQPPVRKTGGRPPSARQVVYFYAGVIMGRLFDSIRAVT
jgi:hypothetical protein